MHVDQKFLFFARDSEALMRAVCEQCDTVQPVDWAAGDLCINCGAVVRRERRCHWCCRLTPDGAFCRHCGSGLVPDDQYGVARMLKAGGVDQFSLPERLEKMPPAQLEHFSRLYAPHERAVERHVDDLHFVESFLRGRGWSAELEETLLPQLPLSEDRLRALTLPPAQALGDTPQLEEIRGSTPFEVTGQLAGLARIRLMVERNTPDADSARSALASPDERVRDEAALTLGRWSSAVIGPFAVRARDLETALIAAYERDPSPEVALALTLLKQSHSNVWGLEIDPGVLKPLLSSEDKDLAFGAALALSETERLLPALGIPARRDVAAIALAKLGVVAPLEPVLPQLKEYALGRVLSILEYGIGAVPALHDALLKIMDDLDSSFSIRRQASSLLALENRPEDALRLLEVNDSLIDAVLRNPALSTIETERVLIWLLERGKFNQYLVAALGELAASERVSNTFVPDTFNAADDYGRQELAAFAGKQLEAHRNQGLHRFLWSVVEGGGARQARERVWAALSGWYSYSREGEEPLKFSLSGTRHYFGSLETFLERLCIVLEQPRILNDLFVNDDFLRLLQDVDDDALPGVHEHRTLLERLRRGLWTLVQNGEVYSRNRVAALMLIGRLATSKAERETFQETLGELFMTDPPWDVRRAGLEALDEAERRVLGEELRAMLEGELPYERREIAKNLLGDLEAMQEG